MRWLSDGSDPQVEELETSLDLPLQLVYMKQLTLLREKALQRYKTLAKGSETSDYQVPRYLLFHSGRCRQSNVYAIPRLRSTGGRERERDGKQFSISDSASSLAS